MKPASFLALAFAVVPALTITSAPRTDDLHEKVLNTIADFKKADPDIEKFFKSAVGYAVFPTIGKGAVGIGGAHGSGELLVAGKAVGKCKLTQVTVGFQLGGQSYSEIIFFQEQNTVDGFKNGDFAFSAQATAVAVTAGAAANAAYRNDVAVFTRAKGGLMYEASIGGQKFSFKPYGAD